MSDPLTNLNLIKNPRTKSPLKRIFALFSKTIIIMSTLVVGGYFLLATPPMKSEYPVRLDVDEGDSLGSIAMHAEDAGVIKSKTVFQTLIYLLGGDRRIKAGTYVVEEPSSVFDVALLIASGKRDINALKVTIPEGFSRIEIATLIDEKIPTFDKDLFLEKTKGQEGYLFPETYFFLKNTSVDAIISSLRGEFDKRTASLASEITARNISMQDLITMASIIEKEATGESDRTLISGVLWKRLELGMPLQVDATFLYINGKPSAELTLDDLKLNSPYNTYVYKGLPPGPICSPGLASIIAALRPESSSYLYYLHDKDGGVHFAKNFEEHKANKAKYLK